MDNTTRNASGPLGEKILPEDSALFLAILLVVIAMKLILIAAVIAERSTNCTVRLILVNLLLSSVISSISIVFYDIFGILGGLGYVGRFTYRTRVWFMIGILIFYSGGTAQVLFVTMYSVAIFLQIRFWNRPVLKPRSTKYFILTTVCVYIVAFISATPLLYLYFETTPTAFCDCYLYSIIIVSLHSLFLSVLPAIFSLIILIVTVHYYKRNSLHQDKHNDKGLQGLLHFGFFLFAVQVMHFAAHVLLPIMLINLLNRFFDDTFFSVRSVFDGIHLTIIPTPILILIFFKPARETLTRWLTCRFRCQKKCSRDAVAVPT